MSYKTLLAVVLLCSLPAFNIASAHTALPSIFGSNMVLQQKQQNRIWGWGDPDDTIEVTIADQKKTTKVDDDG